MAETVLDRSSARGLGQRTWPHSQRRDASDWVDCGQDSALSREDLWLSAATVLQWVTGAWSDANAVLDERQLFTDLMATLLRLERLEDEAEDWRRPDPRAIAQARVWLIEMASEILSSRSLWLRPQVAAGLEGEVELEWWHEGRSLTVYLSANGATYIESWGTNIDTQMNEGRADSPEDRQAMWAQLVG